jgi:hypothetical protein
MSIFLSLANRADVVAELLVTFAALAAVAYVVIQGDDPQ